MKQFNSLSYFSVTLSSGCDLLCDLQWTPWITLRHVVIVDEIMSGLHHLRSSLWLHRLVFLHDFQFFVSKVGVDYTLFSMQMTQPLMFLLAALGFKA